MYLIISPKRSLEVSLFFAEINLSYFEESQISVLIWFTKGILLTCWPISESKSLLCLKSKSPEQRCRPLFVWSNFEGCLVLFAPAFADQAHLSHCIVNLIGINGNNRPFAIWFNLKRRKETCGHLIWYFLHKSFERDSLVGFKTRIHKLDAEQSSHCRDKGWNKAA